MALSMSAAQAALTRVPAPQGKAPAARPAPAAFSKPLRLATPVRKTVQIVKASHQVNAAAVEEKLAVDWGALAERLEEKSPLEIMDNALATFGSDIAIAFSGAEDVALVEYAHLTGRPFRVFSLDTGRLNPETYRVMDAVEKRYNVRIEYTFPEADKVKELVRSKGLFSFYEDGHTECCRVRKVQPLRRELKGLKAWITGQRRDQSPGTRSAVPVVQVDPVFEGLGGGPGSLVKYNPLSNMTSAEVWNFLRVQDVPVNELHAQGYVSIGCEPCTRAVLPNQHEREGRWWWEDAASKECGLHSGNIIQVAEGEAKQESPDLFTSPAVRAVGRGDLEALLGGRREKDTLAVLYAPWCQFCQAFDPTYNQLAEQLQGGPVDVVKFQADVEREFASSQLGLATFPTLVFLPASSDKVIKYPTDRRDLETLGMWVRAMAGFSQAMA